LQHELIMVELLTAISLTVLLIYLLCPASEAQSPLMKVILSEGRGTKAVPATVPILSQQVLAETEKPAVQPVSISIILM
jgi:hypothetical protein